MRAVSNKFYLIIGSRSNDWKIKAFWRQKKKKSQLGTYRIQEDVSLSLLYWEFSSSEVVPVSKEGILRFLGRCQGTRTSWDLNCKRQRMLLDRRMYISGGGEKEEEENSFVCSRLHYIDFCYPCFASFRVFFSELRLLLTCQHVSKAVAFSN